MYSVPSAASAMSTCVFSVPLAAMHSDSKICGAPDSTQGMHRAVLASRGAVPWGSSAESAGSSAKEATKKPSTAAHRHALLWKQHCNSFRLAQHSPFLSTSYVADVGCDGGVGRGAPGRLERGPQCKLSWV
eukprot:scaffold69997_cov19-Tisochrysis_lutea.AAC.1